jgi:hypothetical protein
MGRPHPGAGGITMLKWGNKKNKVEVIPMQWTTDIPTEAGHYLCRYMSGGYTHEEIYVVNGLPCYISFNKLRPAKEMKAYYSHFMKIEDPVKD